MSGTIDFRVLDESEFEAWERFNAGSPDGSIYASPKYLQVLAAETDADVRILAAERGGQIIGGIALYERSCRVGRYVAPRLLLYYNGPVLGRTPSKYPSERTSFQVRLLSGLESELRQLGLAGVSLHPRETLTDARPFTSHGWSATPSYSYVLSLEDPKEAWSRVEGNFRRLVKRCERDGFQLSTDDDFESFYRLHREIYTRKGGVIYLPKENFRRYFEALRSEGLCRLYHARTSDGQAVSSQLVLLGRHPVCHTVCAGSDGKFLNSGASVFLRWRAAEALAEEGYQGVDLTSATLDSVTRFKSQLGAELSVSLALHGPHSLPLRCHQGCTRAWRFTTGKARGALRRLRRARAKRAAAGS